MPCMAKLFLIRVNAVIVYPMTCNIYLTHVGTIVMLICILYSSIARKLGQGVFKGGISLGK